jgi:hypothetical protein
VKNNRYSIPFNNPNTIPQIHLNKSYSNPLQLSTISALTKSYDLNNLISSYETIKSENFKKNYMKSFDRFLSPLNNNKDYLRKVHEHIKLNKISGSPSPLYSKEFTGPQREFNHHKDHISIYADVVLANKAKVLGKTDDKHKLKK